MLEWKYRDCTVEYVIQIIVSGITNILRESTEKIRRTLLDICHLIIFVNSDRTKNYVQNESEQNNIITVTHK